MPTQPCPQHPECTMYLSTQPSFLQFLFTVWSPHVSPLSESSLRLGRTNFSSELILQHHPFTYLMISCLVSISPDECSVGRMGYREGGLVHMCHPSTQHRTWYGPGVQYLLFPHSKEHPSIFSFTKCLLRTRDTAVRRQAGPCSSAVMCVCVCEYYKDKWE